VQQHEEHEKRVMPHKGTNIRVFLIRLLIIKIS